MEQQIYIEGEKEKENPVIEVLLSDSVPGMKLFHFVQITDLLISKIVLNSYLLIKASGRKVVS